MSHSTCKRPVIFQTVASQCRPKWWVIEMGINMDVNMGINMFWALLRAHSNPGPAAWALNRARPKHIPANMNSIILLTVITRSVTRTHVRPVYATPEEVPSTTRRSLTGHFRYVSHYDYRDLIVFMKSSDLKMCSVRTLQTLSRCF